MERPHTIAAPVLHKAIEVVDQRSALSSTEEAAATQHGQQGAPSTTSPRHPSAHNAGGEALMEPLSPSSSALDEAARSSLESSLATLFKVSVGRVSSIRKHGRFFSLIDVASIVTGYPGHDASQQIREVLRQFSEIRACVTTVQFPGRGQRSTPVADIYGVVQFIMLLPGRGAAAVRQQAAELFVRYHGGDASLVSEIVAARARQVSLQREEPEHPLRAFGEAVEASREEEQGSGPTPSQASRRSLTSAPSETISLWEELRSATRLTGERLVRHAVLVRTCFLELLRREAEAGCLRSSEGAAIGASLSARQLRCSSSPAPVVAGGHRAGRDARSGAGRPRRAAF